MPCSLKCSPLCRIPLGYLLRTFHSQWNDEVCNQDLLYTVLTESFLPLGHIEQRSAAPASFSFWTFSSLKVCPFHLAVFGAQIIALFSPRAIFSR